MCSVLGWRLCHLPGQPLPLPDHSFHEKKFPNIQDNSTSLLPNKLCHPCPGLERKGSCRASGLGLGEAESKDTQDFSPVSAGWSVGAWGLSQGVPKGPEVSQQLGIGSASGTSQGNRGTNAQTSAGTEEPLACLLTLRNPIHNQTLNPIPWAESGVFLLRVQGKTAHS